MKPSGVSLAAQKLAVPAKQKLAREAISPQVQDNKWWALQDSNL
jgi:hypothetical protein